MASDTVSYTPGSRPKYISFDCHGTLIRFRNSATDLGLGRRVFVAREHELSKANYRDIEIPNIGCLPAAVGQ